MVDDMAEQFGVTKHDLALMAGFKPATLQRKARAEAPATVARLGEIAEIVFRVSEWAGGQRQALAWYRSHPLPAFGDRTAESLVKTGKAADVRDYLDHLALGGFA